MKKSQNEENDVARWLTYRPEIKVLDCTVRDGGLMNEHNFDDEAVKAVYDACVAGGIDYMELGYKGSKSVFSPTQYGPWKFCSEDDIRRIVGDNDTDVKLSVMADAERTDYHTDIIPKDESPLDLIRVACYIHQIPTALDMVKDAHEKGYETAVNLMAISIIPDRELDKAMELIAASDADIMYLVDSFGALYSEQTRHIIKKYMSYMEPLGKRVGMHAHNNLQLAFSNTIEAIVNGANMLDGSMAGFGRGAGNCNMELLTGFLHNPKYKSRPLYECIHKYIEPLRKDLLWGFDLPYMITGFLNQHPRDAIKFNLSEDRGNIVKFNDMMAEKE
ncbi:MAG: nucleoid-structuring protein H-NS [Chlamydiae bacterium]|nr:MAG: nucleoid-structuring protein H-NS [Chlamydiota bacterium]